MSVRYLHAYKVTDTEILACVDRRFATFDVKPRLASPSDTITIAGKLEYHDPACFWHPAGGDEVELYVDGSKRRTTSTQADGSFRFELTGKDLGLGKHVVYCYAPSFTRWVGVIPVPVCDVKSDERVVEVVTEEEKRERERQEQTMSMLTYGLIAAGAVAAIGVAIGLYQRERQRRLMMALLARRR